MASPSPSQKAAAFQRKSNLALVVFSGFALCILLIILYNDPDAIFHIHLALAFAISTTLFAPIDRAQVLLQTQDAHPRLGLKDTLQYSSTIGCILRVRRDQGWAALWRGNISNVLKKVLTALVSGCAVRMALVLVRNTVPLHEGSVREGLMQQLAAHGIAAAAWTALLYPFEYIHTRMSVDSGKAREFTGMLDCLQKSVTREGLHSPYKGLTLALYELVVHQGCHSVLYIGMSKFLDSRKGLKILEKMSKIAFLVIPLMHLLNSCIAGLVAYPLETVRRRVILQIDTEEKRSSLMQCSKRTLEEEGLQGFYKGVSAKALLTACCALMASALLDWFATQNTGDASVQGVQL